MLQTIGSIQVLTTTVSFMGVRCTRAYGLLYFNLDGLYSRVNWTGASINTLSLSTSVSPFLFLKTTLTRPPAFSFLSVLKQTDQPWVTVDADMFCLSHIVGLNLESIFSSRCFTTTQKPRFLTPFAKLYGFLTAGQISARVLTTLSVTHSL